MFTVSSLLAIALGAATLAATRHPIGSWIRNPIAWVVGLAVAVALMRVRNSFRVRLIILAVSISSVAGTFLAPPQSGVHRWIDLGPLHINMAALVIPSAIVALTFCGIWSGIGLGFVAAMAALLILQPDASQATGFLVAVIALLAFSSAPRPRRLIAIAAALVIAAIAWTRPDPLRPVAEVEGIFGLAMSVSPLLAGAAAVALGAASLSPLVVRPNFGSSPQRAAALALAGYFITVALCPAFGAFPVPLVGLGMSFPLGYWLGVALLCGKRDDLGVSQPAAGKG